MVVRTDVGVLLVVLGGDLLVGLDRYDQTACASHLLPRALDLLASLCVALARGAAVLRRERSIQRGGDCTNNV